MMEKKRLVETIMFRIFLLLIFIVGFHSLSFAEVIHLKSGGKVEGKIVERTDEYIKLNFGGGIVITYLLDEIESIEEEKRIDYEYGKVELEENAAKYYLRADDLMVFPFSEIKQLENEVDEIIKNGWQQKHKKLEDILKANEPFFAEIKKGVALKKCDFQFGKKYKFGFEREPIPITRATYWLLLLKGRYCERGGNFSEAIDLYLSSLTLAYHYSQDDTLVSRRIALRIEKDSYIPLRDYLDSGEVDKKISAKIANFLDNYEQQHFSIKGLVEQEKEYFISTLHITYDPVKKDFEKKFESDYDKKKKANEFVDEFIRQCEELADRYYGNFIKAAETNKERDWKHALSELEKLEKEAQLELGLIGTAKDISQLLFNVWVGKTEEFNRQYIRKLSILVFSAALPVFDVKEVIDDYYVNLKELKDLKSLASIKAR